jgi:biopolymer transport protein ExbD
LRRIQTRQLDDSQPDINITPLIDVVFVILIAFILLAPLFEMDQIELANSGEGSSEMEAKSTSPLQITVRRDNSILFNAYEVTLEELRELVVAEKEKYPEERPKLIHDKQAYFGTYQEIKNILTAAGFEELDIILNPSSGK